MQKKAKIKEKVIKAERDELFKLRDIEMSLRDFYNLLELKTDRKIKQYFYKHYNIELPNFLKLKIGEYDNQKGLIIYKDDSPMEEMISGIISKKFTNKEVFLAHSGAENNSTISFCHDFKGIKGIKRRDSMFDFIEYIQNAENNRITKEYNLKNNYCFEPKNFNQLIKLKEKEEKTKIYDDNEYHGEFIRKFLSNKLGKSFPKGNEINKSYRIEEIRASRPARMTKKKASKKASNKRSIKNDLKIVYKNSYGGRFDLEFKNNGIEKKELLNFYNKIKLLNLIAYFEKEYKKYAEKKGMQGSIHSGFGNVPSLISVHDKEIKNFLENSDFYHIKFKFGLFTYELDYFENIFKNFTHKMTNRIIEKEKFEISDKHYKKIGYFNKEYRYYHLGIKEIKELTKILKEAK